MEYTTLGRTGLRVSVAGLGTGGFSRLGLKTGKTEDEAARLIHEAVGLGINFIDTAPSYGTEGVVGQALKTIPRDQVVIATKAQCSAAASGARPSAWSRASTIRCALMGTDYVDVFNLHGVEPRRVRLCAQRASRRRCSNRSARARSGTSASPRTRSSISPTRCSSARCAIRRVGGVHGGLPHAAPGRAARTCFRSRARRASARC